MRYLGACRLLPSCLAVILAFPVAGALMAQDEKKEGGGSSLGDLFSKVKDLKVPDSVSTLPAQLTELKDAYLKTAETVEQLQKEVAALREEVATLHTDNATLREAVADKRVRDDLSKAAEATSAELVDAFAGDRLVAEKKWKDRFVKVTGPIESFESGTGAVYVFLRGDSSGTMVRCAVNRDANFHVDVLVSQGRVIDRNDRSTVLTVGQPVTVVGTCTGAELHVTMENCKIEGVQIRRQ